MIQSVEGVIMVKGNIPDILADLGAIVFALAKKDVPHEAIIATVANALATANDKDSDDLINTVIDKVFNNDDDKEPELEIDSEPLNEDLLKRMFGDLFDE